MNPFVRILATTLLASSLTACASIPGMQPVASNAMTGTVTGRVAPSNYYRMAEGLKGQALLNALNAIVARHTELGYDRARDLMFAEVDDLDNNDIVECDYTNRSLDQVTDRKSAYRNGTGFNAEHTWPQSKGAEGVAKSDLHHLFPTDCEANSRRSSFPFGEVVTVEWTDGGSKLGKDARGVTVFEPRDDHKGNTARALFYFYTVYGHQADLSNFRYEEATLKAWHRLDPVTPEERLRNDVVFRFQGNRNPFVDRPEFVSAVGNFLPVVNTPAFNGFGY